MKKILSVMLAVMMVLSTVSFAAPTAVGTVDAGTAPAVSDVFEVEEADLASDSAYGTLLFDIDFEGDAFVSEGLLSGSSVQNYSSIAQPELPEGFDAYYALVGNTFECAFVDTDGYEINYTNTLKVYTPNDPSYPHVAIQSLESASNWNDNYPGFPDGTYTVVVDAAYDYNNSKPAIIQARFSDDGSYKGGNAIGEQWAMNYAEGALDNYVISWDVFNQADGTTKIVTADGTEKEYATIKSMGVYFGQLGNNPDFVYVDNYKMYWKPNTVNVTINNNGEFVKTITASTKGILVSDLVKEAGLGAEFSVTEVLVNGEKKILSDTVVFGADSVVDITSEKLDLSAFQSPEKGVMLFNITFEDYAAGTTLNNAWSLEDPTCVFLTDASKTPLSDSVMSHDLTNWGIFGQGVTYTIMQDPNNPDNMVVGALNATSTGYPQFRIDTYRDSMERKGDRADVAWGFVEEDGAVLTLEYDFMDKDGVLRTTDRFGGQSSIANTIINKDTGEYHSKWAEFEDQGTESSPAKVAGEYRTMVTTYSDANLASSSSRMGSTAEVSFIKIHSAAPANNSYYIDNVKLWYKPGKADITVKNIGRDLPDVVLEDVKTSGISANEIVTLMGVPASANYAVKGISYTEDAEEFVDTAYFAGDSTIYLVWEEVDMSAFTDENGILLFELNFNDLAVGTSINSQAKLTTIGRVNPNFPKYADWALEYSTFTSPGSVTDFDNDGNNELTFTYSGTGKWPQVLVGNLPNNVDNVLTGGGTYYASVDYYVGSEATDLLSVQLTSNGVVGGVHQGPNSVIGFQSLYTSNAAFPFNGWGTLAAAKNTVEAGADDINKITTVFTMATGGKGPYTFHMDNIKLYWRPHSVNVTIDAGDNTEAGDVTFTAKTTGITVEDAMANMVDWGSKKLVGLSRTEGGEALAAGTVLSFASDTTLYAVWEDFGALLEGFGAEFNGVNSFDEVSFATYGQGADSSAVYEYSKFTYEEGNTKYFSYKALPVEGADGVIDAQIRLDNQLPKGAVKGVAVRLRITGMPTEDYAVTIPERTLAGKASNLEVFKAYYAVGSLGLAEARTISAKRDWTSGALDGKWMTLYFDLSAKAEVAENDFKYLRIDFPDALPKDVVVDIDYIRFYGDNSELSDKPTTYKELSMRANAGNSDGNNGVRFKAALTGATNATASDYGFVVAVASKLNTRAITIGWNSAVKAYYGRQDNVDLVKFFDSTDDNNLVFSAVLKNIKPEYAKTAIVARPFAIVEGVEYYGDPIVFTAYEVACAIRDGGYVGVDKDYIDSIIAYGDAE